METSMQQLVQRVCRLTEQGELPFTAISGLALFRREEPTEPVSSLYEPSVCLVVQGAKRVLLGEEAYIYDANHYLITAVRLPTVVQVISASRELPYLGLRLKLDMREVSQLMVDSNLPSPPQQGGRGMAIGQVTPVLVNAVLRLVDLLEEPQDIPILAPIIEREIIYRLLTGDQGPRLRQMASVGGQGHQIARAIDWLHGNFNRPLRVEELARYVSMSPSAFHQHFRALTTMSPLQYQKWLRLNEARRLMLAEPLDVASASFQVGYESPSQFNREYSRLFGTSPLKDITNLRRQMVGREVRD